MTADDLAAINHIRLERNLTWRRLGDEIGVGLWVIYRAIRNPGHLTDRHEYRIMRWLDAQRGVGHERT